MIFPSQYNCFDITQPPDKITDATFIPDASVTSFTLKLFFISKFPEIKTFFFILAPPSTMNDPDK